MSDFFHKIESAFHGHHHDSTPSNDQSHSTTSKSQTEDGKQDTHHTHHHNTRQNAHLRSQAEKDRADFLADREYDRGLRSPDRGPGLGFET